MIGLTKRFAKNVVHKLGQWYGRELCRREHEAMHFQPCERPIEYRFLFQQLTRIMPRTVLDVGTGTSALPFIMQRCGPLVTATDNVRDYWANGLYNRHYHIIDDDITNTRLKSQFDVITCISVLEHIARPDDAVRNMFRLLKPGGHLILTFPYNESHYIDNVYQLPGAGYGKDLPYICQVYSRVELQKWSEQNSACIQEQEYWECF